VKTELQVPQALPVQLVTRDVLENKVSEVFVAIRVKKVLLVLQAQRVLREK
jgi:hypothetical protein